MRERAVDGQASTAWPSMRISPVVGAHQAHHHVEGGGLAGAVGAQQADHLTGTHGQVHVLDHRRVP
jgi:hypothetical protein